MDDGARRTRSGFLLQPCREYVPLAAASEDLPSETGPSFAAGAALAAAFASVLAVQGLRPEMGQPPGPTEEQTTQAAPEFLAISPPIPSQSPRPYLGEGSGIQAEPAVTPFTLKAEERPSERPEAMLERSAPKPRLVLLSCLSGFFHAAATRDGFTRLAVAQSLFWKNAWMGVAPKGPRPIPTTAAPAQQLAGEASLMERLLNTDVSKGWMSQAKWGREKFGRNAEGQATLTFRSGVKMIQLEYDQSKPIGERNTVLMESPDMPPVIVKFSPLIFDLKGGGVRASDRWVRYDLAGDGRYQRLHDIASTNGVLVFDARGAGIAGKNGRELFGDRADIEGAGRPTGFKDGFEALDALVRAAERRGVLPPGTRARGRLGKGEMARLEKAYGLGMRVGGLLKKTVSLEEAGVREILLSDAPSRRVKDFDGQGDDVVRREGAVFIRADGTTGRYEDVFLRAELSGFEQLSIRETR